MAETANDLRLGTELLGLLSSDRGLVLLAARAN